MRNYSSVSHSYGSPRRSPRPYGARRQPPQGRRPGGGSSFRNNRGPGGTLSKKLWIIIGAAAAAVVVILCLVFSGVFDEVDIEDGIIADNVTIEGVAVGGMNVDEARTALAMAANAKGENAVIKLEVPSGGTSSVIDVSEDAVAEAADQPAGNDLSSGVSFEVTETSAEGMQVVDYPASRSGIYADVDTAIKSALEYTKSIQGMSANDAEDLPVQDIPLTFAIDAEFLTASLTEDAESWNIAPQTASFGLEILNSEENLTTSAEPIVVNPKDGVSVDVPAFAALITERIAAQNLTDVMTAPTVITQPEGDGIDPSQYEVIGEYSTSYATPSSLSKENRMYNIWKMSACLNGTYLAPGETMSVNDIAGPRTEDLGWKLAVGIEDGGYTDQAGGGICQVTSTLYIAAMKAEMKIVSRTHHSIPVVYMPLGLDATVSTGSPDLKLQNNTEYPMYVAINCDVSDRSVDVKVYGIKPRDYTLRFENKQVEVIPEPEIEYIADETVPEGQTVEEGSGRDGYVVEVYKVWYDKETGEEVDRARIYTDTYTAMGKKVRYNPLTPPPEVAPPVTDMTVTDQTATPPADGTATPPADGTTPPTDGTTTPPTDGTTTPPTDGTTTPPTDGTTTPPADSTTTP